MKLRRAEDNQYLFIQQQLLLGKIRRVEAMFQDIDWCEGQWCPLPRPVLSQEDKETIEGFGLQCTFVENVWTGTPEFEGWLETVGAPVKLFCRLVAHEGDSTYMWRVQVSGEAVLDMLPNAYVIENEDPIAAVAEAVMWGAEARKHLPRDTDHAQDALAYASIKGLDLGKI